MMFLWHIFFPSINIIIKGLKPRTKYIKPKKRQTEELILGLNPTVHPTRTTVNTPRSPKH